MLTRSYLFVPGISDKLMNKAENLSADLIIYDLEDAVSLEQKEDARNTVINALNKTEKSIIVRINSIDTPFFVEDILALSQVQSDSLEGIMLPKANNDSDVTMLSRLLDATKVPQSVKIIPLIETAQGVQNAPEIASASERVHKLAFGSIDFSLDIGATLTKSGTEILFARSQIVLASRVANIEPPIDTVYGDFKDLNGLAQETKMIKNLGFGGKLAIHPSQVDIINQEFLPSNEEILEAKIIDVVNSEGTAVFQLNGKMIDEPVIQKAIRIHQQAKQLELN